MSEENIVSWLRSTSGLVVSHPHLGGYTSRHGEAADEIERLTAENERLRASLKHWEDKESHEGIASRALEETEVKR